MIAYCTNSDHRHVKRINKAIVLYCHKTNHASKHYQQEDTKPNYKWR